MKHTVYVMAAGPSREFKSVTNVPKPYIRFFNTSLVNHVIRNSGLADQPDVNISVLVDKQHQKYLDYSPITFENVKVHPLSNVRLGSASTLINFLITQSLGDFSNGFWVMPCDRIVPNLSTSILDRVTSTLLDSGSHVGVIVTRPDTIASGMGNDVDVLRFSSDRFTFDQGSDTVVAPNVLSGLLWFRSPKVFASLFVKTDADHNKVSVRQLLDYVDPRKIHVDRVESKLIALSTPDRLTAYVGYEAWIAETTSFYSGPKFEDQQ